MDDKLVRADAPIRLDNVSLKCVIAATLASGAELGDVGAVTSVQRVERYLEILKIMKQVSVYPQDVDKELQTQCYRSV